MNQWIRRVQYLIGKRLNHKLLNHIISSYSGSKDDDDNNDYHHHHHDDYNNNINNNNNKNNNNNNNNNNNISKSKATSKTQKLKHLISLYLKLGAKEPVLTLHDALSLSLSLSLLTAVVFIAGIAAVFVVVAHCVGADAETVRASVIGRRTIGEICRYRVD